MKTTKTSSEQMPWKAKRQEGQATKAREVDLLAGELRRKYPWAVGPDTSLSTHARAAKNMRLELNAAFPGVTFSVRSRTASMMTAIDIQWKDGPTSEAVNAIVGKYEYGSFNAMTDICEYDSSALGRAVDQVLGRAKYVSTFRRRRRR